MQSHPKTYRHPLKQIGQTALPDSVGIELERWRRALEVALSGDAFDTLTESIVELRMMGADAALLGAIVQRLATLAPRLSGPGGLDAWLTAVREVAQEARHCTLALLQSSEEVLRHGSPAELLMWARLGLRHGQVQSERSDAALAHFELRSRGSAQRLASDDGRSDLASNKTRLAALVRALFDAAPMLLPVEQGLATRRPFLSNLGLHLPEAGRALRGAQARHWYDAAALHAAAHLRHSEHKHPRGSLKPIQIALVGLLEDARVEALAIESMPGLRRLWLGFHIAEPAHGNTFVVLMLRLARALLDPGYDDPQPWVMKSRRLFTEAGAAGCKPAALRDIASHLGNDIGQMRLQFNHRDYVVEPAYRDDNAWLWLPPDDAQAQVQALADEAPLPPGEDGDVDRHGGDGPTSVAARPAAGGESATDAPALAKWQYAEWDRLVGDYRVAWCTVIEERPAPADARGLQAAITRHRALLLRLERVLRAGRLRERVKLRAQPSGDELDIDAAVRSAIDRRTQHPPGQKVHQRQARRERDVAALVLIDSSASTADDCSASTADAVPAREGGGGKILDLAREAALLTTLTLAEAGDRCAIDAFCSNGRHEVRYTQALGFDDALDDNALARLAGVTSRLSTRMGAALRHATHRLAQEQRRKRLLLFITDGEPHDIDIHDRRYLIEDARRAVLEAGRRGITVFCVTLDPAADGYVQAIFGRANYRVLDRIDSLPRLLPAMVLRLTR